MKILILFDGACLPEASRLFWKLQPHANEVSLAQFDGQIPALVRKNLERSLDHPVVIGVLQDHHARGVCTEELRELCFANAPDGPRVLMADPEALQSQVADFLALRPANTAPGGHADGGVRPHSKRPAVRVRAGEPESEIERHPMALANVIFAPRPVITESAESRELRDAILHAYDLLNAQPGKWMRVTGLAAELKTDAEYIREKVVPLASDYLARVGFCFVDNMTCVTLIPMPKPAPRTVSAVQKHAVAEYCATYLVHSGDVILMDGGTSTREVYRSICRRVRAHELDKIVIITNSLMVSNESELADPEKMKLILTGGEPHADLGVLRGDMALVGMRANAAEYRKRGHRVLGFIGTSHVGPSGCFVGSEVELKMKRQIEELIRRAGVPCRVYSPADSKKYHETDGNHMFAPFKGTELTLVTDWIEKTDRPGYVKEVFPDEDGVIRFPQPSSESKS